MTANELTAALLIEIPKRFPQCRVWRQNTGGGIGMSTVKQAIAHLKVGNIVAAIYCLSSRPIKWGIEGAGDISGIMLRNFGFENNAGLRLEIEVKVGRDKQSDEQKGFQSMIESLGGIYIIARDVEGCLKELGEYA